MTFCQSELKGNVLWSQKIKKPDTAKREVIELGNLMAIRIYSAPCM